MKTYSLVAGVKHQTTRCVHDITVRNSDVIVRFPKNMGSDIASMPEMPKAMTAFAITTIMRPTTDVSDRQITHYTVHTD